MTYHLYSEAKELFGEESELFSRYSDYLAKQSTKRILLARNRTSATDSQRSKVYHSERLWLGSARENNLPKIVEFQDYNEALKYFNKVVRSRTYEKLCAEFKGVSNPRLEMKKDRWDSRSAGLAYSNGLIKLCPRYGLDEHVLLHELAHTCGNTHHDVGFRVALVKLVSRFISREHGKLLHKAYRANRLKMSLNKDKKPKSPADWLKFYNRLQNARSARKAT